MLANQDEKLSGTVKSIALYFKNRLEDLESQIANLVRVCGGTKMSGEKSDCLLSRFNGGTETYTYEIAVDDVNARKNLEEVKSILTKGSAITKQDCVRIMAIMTSVKKAPIFNNSKLDLATEPKDHPYSNLETFKQDLTKFLCNFVPDFREMEQARIDSKSKTIRMVAYLSALVAAPTIFCGGMAFQENMSYKQKLEKERAEAKAKAEQQVPQK